MCTWWAWEYAVYQRYVLPEPVLDGSCGDGCFLRLVWPQIFDVIGVDVDPGAADMAQRSGIYSKVHIAPAHALAFEPERFASAFANCSLEHMDHLSEVLNRICRSLRPSGSFLVGVVTDKFLEWAMLPLLMDYVGEAACARALQADYEAYHHLVNRLPPEAWVEHLEKAGFEVLEHTPIVPELTSRLFLFLDHSTGGGVIFWVRRKG